MKFPTILAFVVFAGHSALAQPSLFGLTGYTTTAADAISKKNVVNGTFGIDGVLDQSGGDQNWQDKAKITITGITTLNDFNNFHLSYTGTDGQQKSADATLQPDKTNKKISFVILNLIGQSKDNIFTLTYPDTKTVLGTFAFTVRTAVQNPNNQQHQVVAPQQPPATIDPTSDKSLYQDALNFVGNLTLNPALKYDSRFNVYRKAGNKQSDVIVIYVDAAGDLLYTPVPTTGIRNFKYEVHLIKRVNDANNYALVRPEGGLTDALNVMSSGTPSMPTGGAVAAAAQPQDPNLDLEQRVYPALGPYESDFKVSLMRTDPTNAAKSTDLIGSTVKVATFYYASIQVGLVATTLRNPQNITPAKKPNGDSTLTADDPFTRGIFSVMAVFYPKGRSFLFPPSGGVFSPERFGVIVGTQLDKTQFQNFLGGLQFDFARGGSISLGAHYGRRTTIEGYKNFNFGNDSFYGDLTNKVKQEWNLGFFFGVNIDVKIFNYLFGSSSSSSSK